MKYQTLVWLGAICIASFAYQEHASAQAAGECSSGFCGTPRQVGGGGCGCGGGSILINNTDVGETYSTSDDFDGDGFEDDFDNCPFVANRDQLDADNDAVGSACDNAPRLSNPNQEDADGDGIGDVADPDIDNDGLENPLDACPGVFNPTQRKTLETSTLGDACNDDDDGDGVLDVEDACPKVPGAVASNGLDCDADEDLDGTLDGADNCPSIANPIQSDLNGDGFGDACDADKDGDGVLNNLDNAPDDANPDQTDLDRNGIGDVAQSGLCYVFDRTRPTDCLDPLDTFKVGGFATVDGQGPRPGTPLELVLLANRVNTPIQYTWTVLGKPDGSDAVVERPAGKVVASNLGFVRENGGFEYHYQNGVAPRLVPDLAGDYQVRVTAELVFPDETFADGTRIATYQFALSVEGDAGESSGCSTVSGDRSLFVLMLVGALGLLSRRRRA